MRYESFFVSAIEVGIATAGFSGIVAGLRHGTDGTWSRGDLGRISLLLQTSFAAVLLSLVLLALHGAEVPEPLAWRIGSACFVVYMLAGIPLRMRGTVRVHREDASVSLRLFAALVPFLIALTGLQVYNAASLHAGWPIALAVAVELTMALFMFVRLVQTLWKQPAD